MAVYFLIMKILLNVFCLVIVISFCGCASYVTPGPRAELDQLAPVALQAEFARKPTNPFPAGIVTVRLQGSDYSNYHFRKMGGVYGSGKYSVILTREVETDEDVQRIAELPEVRDVIALNRMLLPERVNSYDDLRPGAAKLKADLILVYTFDTRFYDENDSKPLTVVSLGLLPTRVTKATTTASALLMDTRTGFLYGAFEATAQEDLRSSSWGTAEAADKTRLATEKKAFQSLVEEIVSAWPRLLEQYANEKEL